MGTDQSESNVDNLNNVRRKEAEISGNKEGIS